MFKLIIKRSKKSEMNLNKRENTDIIDTTQRVCLVLDISLYCHTYKHILIILNLESINEQ